MQPMRNRDMAGLKQFWIAVTIVFDKVTDIMAYIAGVFVVIIMFGITAEVASRRLLLYSIVGVHEISEYLLVYITFLGTTWLLKREGHVKMDFVINNLRINSQALINFITSTICSVLCLTIALYSALTTIDVWQRGLYSTTVLECPIAPLVAPIPIGFLLLFIQFTRRAHKYFGVFKGNLSSKNN